MNNISQFVSYSRFPKWFMALMLSALLAGCGGGGDGGGDPVLGIGGPGGVPDLTAKAITSYSLAGVGGFRIAGVIDQTAKTISVTMPFGTPPAALVATFTTTGTGVTVAGVPQVSGTTANDFTTSIAVPLAYVVTAVDGSTATYKVSVTVATISAKAITSFSLNGIAGIITEGTIPKTITVIMPAGTDLTTPKTATFVTTGTGVTVAGAAQTSGTTTNVFTQGTPKVYTVTAQDASTATYNVNVSVALTSDKAIISYSLNGIAGIISEGTVPKTISVIMPIGTDLTKPMTATFLTTGTSVKVAGVLQTSGVTTNVFPLSPPASAVYTVTAQDGSGPATYNVNVSVALATDKAITSYSLNGIAGVISEGTIPKTITVVMPSGTDLTKAMTASFTTTGTSVLIGATQQFSGLPPTNVFTQGTPKVYTVAAADASTASYNVNVSVALATDKQLTSYSLDGIAGVISELTTPKTVTVVMPAGTDLTKAMTATFTTTGTSVLIGATQQFSGLPPTNVFTQGTPKVYTVTAGDASTASYNVNVSVALATDKQLTSYSLNGIAGVISEGTTPKTVTVVMPAGTDLTKAMTATFTTTGTSVLIGATQQFSGLPPTNVFTQGTPMVYTVTAGDASTASYNVNVSVSPVATIPGPAGAVDLGIVAPYGIIAYGAITNSAGPSHIYGDAALTGAVAASVTGPGFMDGGLPGAKTSTGVTDSAGVNPGIVIATDNGNTAALPPLIIALKAVYDDLALRPAGAAVLTDPASAVGKPGGTFTAPANDLSGFVLSPGIYTATGAYGLGNAKGALVLDAGGNADAVFIIRSTSAASGLTSTTGSIVLRNGAQSKNVYWVVENATIGASTFFQGTIVSAHAITLLGFANLEGRALAGAHGTVTADALTLTSTNVIAVPK